MTHFHGERIDVLVSKQRSMVRDHVLRLTETDLQAPLAGLMAEFVAIYAFEVPVLDKENIDQVEKGEWARAGAPPYAAKALRVVFAVPFVGQKGLFSAALMAPKSGSFNGSVRGDEDLLITVTLDNPTADLIQRDLSTQVAQYEAALDALRGDVQAFNHELPNQVRSLITSRTAKLKRDSAALAELPFRVRRREDALIPVPVKKVVRVARAEHNSGQSYAREHVVPDADYDEILASTRSMGKVMERSPGTFSWLTEEGIRDFFLVVLNFGFRGEALPEVFHGKGIENLVTTRRLYRTPKVSDASTRLP